MAIARTQYKRPSRINPVSISVLLFFALCGYVGYSFWPVFTLRTRVKDELMTVLPDLYRANIRGEAFAKPETIRIKKDLIAKIKKAGVTDEKLQVVLTRDKKIVAAEALFDFVVTFKGLKKTVVVHCSPRAETDSARVEW